MEEKYLLHSEILLKIHLINYHLLNLPELLFNKKITLTMFINLLIWANSIMQEEDVSQAKIMFSWLMEHIKKSKILEKEILL